MTLVLVRRSTLYMFCVVAVYVATILYIIGFLAPYWQRNIPNQFWQGIWFSCFDNGNCLRFEAGTDWMKAVRILQILGLLGLILACAFIMFYNCRTKYRGHSRLVEIITLLSALIGFSGAMVYVGYWRRDVETSDGRLKFAWAFALNVGACGLAIITAIIFFCANTDLKAKEGSLETLRPMEWADAWDERAGLGPAVIPNHRICSVPRYPVPWDGIPDSPEDYRRNRYDQDPAADYPQHFRSPRESRTSKQFGEYPGPHPYPYPYVISAHSPGPSYPRRFEEEAGGPYSNIGPYYDDDIMAGYPGPMVRMSPILLPRLIIRSPHEPGYGHQEYWYQ